MYIPKEWFPREGTNLNKFTKSGETASSVILTNAPDAITQAGTPFTADAMNNIEAGIQETRGGPFPSPSEFTTGLTTPYGLAYDGTALYVTERDSGKVKKINISTGVAAEFTTGLTTPYGLTYDGTALYVTEWNSGKVKKINLSTGVAAEFTTGLTNPFGLTYDGTALYVTERSTGKVKKINISTGVAAEFTTGLTDPFGLTYDGTALYVTERNTGKVKKIPTFPEFIAPSSVLPQSITSANVTMTEDRFGNILLSGVLTGNRELILPSTVRTYKIINNCTGAYYVHVKTASGTGVYMAPEDIWDVYCDGVNIKPISLLSSTREISLPTIIFNMGGTDVLVPMSSVTPTSDVLSEIGSNVFTAKNKGKYQIRAYAVPSIDPVYIFLDVYVNGDFIFSGGRDSVNTGYPGIRAAVSTIVSLNAGETLSLNLGMSSSDSSARVSLIRITQIA